MSVHGGDRRRSFGLPARSDQTMNRQDETNVRSIPGVFEFRRQLIIGTLWLSVVTVAFISVYLVTLLDFSVAEWSHFGLLVGGLFPILFGLVIWSNSRLEAPILVVLRAEESGSATEQQIVAGFAALSRLPLAQSIAGLLWWCLGGALVAIGMKLQFDAIQVFPIAILCLASTSGGFIASVFHYFINKRLCGGLLDELGLRIGDEAVRRENVTRVTLRHKLLVSVTGVSVVIVVFAMCLAMVHSGAPVERNATRVQAAFLAAELRGLSSGMPLDAEAVATRARDLQIASQVLLLDSAVPPGRRNSVAPLTDVELEVILGSPSGRSTELDSGSAFAWMRVPGTGSTLVAVTPWPALRGEVQKLGLVFGGLFAMAALLSFMLASYLANDVSSRAIELTEAVTRVAAGDLRVTVRMEAEDELGGLARSFEGMASALRIAVRGVVDAANHVERTAEDIAGIASVVSRGTRTQGQGVQRAVGTMGHINDQVGGIASAARELNALVEESSSSILEMGAASDELSGTAGVLSSRVEDVASSIEQVVRSVREVNTHTRTLSEAASGTSSSMEQMASSMRSVDATAQQAVMLSQRAVEAADGGRKTVQQTIEGMESIRAATEEAERVITGLGRRAAEIGSILDVIEDVADETNLLALNAAIIAAQAGEHGRAFSVVADEIKQLADRVLASTKEIGDLIRAVQSESRNAVEAISEGSRSVATGVERSREAGAALEVITTASRESGDRIQEIVRSVQEQSLAVSHVVAMMGRVDAGAEAIHRATDEQDRGNDRVHRSTVAMRELSLQVRGTTEEQARGGSRIRSSIDGVRDAVEAIDLALQRQTEACREVVGHLEQVSAGGASNDASSEQLAEVTGRLLDQAEALREGVRKFVVEG